MSSSGHKKKSRRTSMVGLQGKFAGMLVEPVGSEVENGMMAVQEALQRRGIDRFWEIDKDSADRLGEKQSMAKEDGLSRVLQVSLLDSEKQRRWDEEYYVKRLEESRVKTLEKERLCRSTCRSWRQQTPQTT
jgi:hypothetical protein